MVLGKRILLATIIVGVAFMMLFSAVAPAMAAGGEKGPPEDICTKLFNKFLLKFGFDRTIELLAKMGCL